METDREVEEATKEISNEELCRAELETAFPGITAVPAGLPAGSRVSELERLLLDGNLGFGNDPEVMKKQFTFHAHASFDFNTTRKVPNSTEIKILQFNLVVLWRWP